MLQYFLKEHSFCFLKYFQKFVTYKKTSKHTCLTMKTHYSYLFLFVFIFFNLLSCSDDESKTKDLETISIQNVSVNDVLVGENNPITVNTSQFALRFSEEKNYGSNCSFQICFVTAANADSVLYTSSNNTSSVIPDSIMLPTKTGTYKIIFNEFNYNTKRIFAFYVNAQISLYNMQSASYSFTSTSSTKASVTTSLLTSLGLTWDGTRHSVWSSSDYTYYYYYYIYPASTTKIVKLSQSDWSSIIYQSQLKSVVDQGTKISSISLFAAYNSYPYSTSYSTEYYGVKYGTNYYMLQFTQATESGSTINISFTKEY